MGRATVVAALCATVVLASCAHPQAQPARVDAAAQARVGDAISRVREQERAWREEVGPTRRLREAFMRLPGVAGTGIQRKKLHFMARDSGLDGVRLDPLAPYHLGELVEVYPLELTGKGTWKALGLFLSKVEASTPEFGLLAYRMVRLKGSEAEVEVRLDARIAMFGRRGMPAAIPLVPRMGPIPEDPDEAVRMLERRLMAVQATRSATRRVRSELEGALEDIRIACLPVRKVLGPLAKAARGVTLQIVDLTGRTLTITGRVGSEDQLGAFVTRLARSHPYLVAVGSPTVTRVPAATGYAVVFDLTATVGPAPEGGAKILHREVPMDTAPPPAPVVHPGPKAPPPAQVVHPEPEPNP